MRMLDKILDVPVGVRFYRIAPYNQGELRTVSFGEFIEFDENKEWYVKNWPDSIKNTNHSLKKSLNDKQSKFYRNGEVDTYDLINTLCDIISTKGALKIIRENYQDVLED